MKRILLTLPLLLVISCVSHKSSDEKETTPKSEASTHEPRTLGLASGATYTVPEGFKEHVKDNYVMVENSSGSVKLFLFENTEPDLTTAVEKSLAIASPAPP